MSNVTPPGKAWNNTPNSRGRRRQPDDQPRCRCGGMFPLHRNTIGGIVVKTCSACDYQLRHHNPPGWVDDILTGAAR